MNYIKSLEELQDWTVGDGEAVVMDWYLDWIFDEVLTKKNYSKFEEAFDAMVQFTERYEKLKRIDAAVMTIQNLKYWEDRANKNWRPFRKYLNKIIIKYLGFQKT